MQTLPHTPANAQHVPDGWSFPTLTPQQPPQPGMPTSRVSGGGAAPATVTRLRWGRVLPLLAGLALVAFGIWTATGDPGGSARSAAGNDSNSLEVSPAAGAEDDAAAGDDATDATTPPAAAAKPKPRPASAKPRPAANRAGAGNGRRPARRTGGAAAGASAFAAASAGADPASANATPSGELPLTGIETWIAGFLGVVLLGFGIVVHVNAVRLAATAMLYRRGILLRPVDCARLAQQRGIPQLRVLVSNVLHRLLEEPAGGPDFVSARSAR